MLRILLVAVAVVVLIAMLRNTLRRVSGEKKRPAPPPAPQADDPRVEDMVACAHCGVHLPRGEAVAAPDGVLFCGEPHRLAHAQGRPPQG
jgi:uncharacterized protein